MALTGHEKPLNEYTKQELIQIAKSYVIYYVSEKGSGRTGGYEKLNKEKLISLIQNDIDYRRSNPNLQNRPNNRIEKLVNSLYGSETPEELMDAIIESLSDNESNSISSGGYYTFIYYAKTPGIIYDQHPLILAGDITENGFFGFNYHWGKIRQYTYPEVASPLFPVSLYEFNSLRQLPYAKFIRR